MSFQPPALAINNQILEAFTKGHELALERQRLAQQKDLALQQLQAEKEYRNQEINLRQKQLDLESAQHQLANLAATQQIGAGITKGENVPGAKIIQQPQPQMSPIQGLSEGQSYMPPTPSPTTISVSHPLLNGGQPFQIESPEEYKRSQIEQTSQLAEAKEAPERKTKLAVQDIESQRATTVEQMKMLQSIIENRNNRENALNIANIRASATLAAAHARGRDREANIASGIGQQFNNHPISKTFDTLSFAKDIANDPSTSDYELLHQYARAQNPDIGSDPQGDIKLIESLPSYGTQLGLKVDQIGAGKKFFDAGLKEQVKKFINNRYQLQEKALKGLRSSFADRIKTTTGEDPEGYLRDATKESISRRKSLDEIFK